MTGFNARYLRSLITGSRKAKVDLDRAASSLGVSNLQFYQLLSGSLEPDTELEKKMEKLIFDVNSGRMDVGAEPTRSKRT